MAANKVPSMKTNYVFNLMYQFIAVLVPLVLTPYLSRTLGADGIGGYSFSLSITTYFIMIANLGSSAYGQRAIAYAGNDMSKRSKIFFEVTLFRMMSSFVVFLLFIVVIHKKENYFLYLAQGINIIAVAFDVSWFFTGLEQFKKVVLRNIFVKLMGMLAIFVFVKTPSDIYLYASIASCSILLGNISLIPYLKRELAHVSERLNPFHGLKSMVQLFLPSIVISAYTVLDKTMLGLISQDFMQNGYYAQSEKIIRTALVIVTSISAVSAPRVASLYAQHNSEEIKRLLYRSYRFSFMLSLPMATGLIMIASNIVPWLLGNGWDSVTPLLRTMALIQITISFSNITGIQYFVPTGRQKVFTKTLAVGAVTNVALNLILIPKFGAAGSATASIFAECLIVIVQFICIRNEISFSKLIGMTPHYIISSLVMGLVLFIINRDCFGGFLGTMVLILIGCSTYIICLLLLKDSLVLEMMNSVLVKFKKIKK